MNETKLIEFGQKCLDDLLRGEWEPDWGWQQEMLEKAEEWGLIFRRPVEKNDNVADEYITHVWEKI